MPNYYYGEEVHKLILEQNAALKAQQAKVDLQIAAAQQELEELHEEEPADPAPANPANNAANWLNGLAKKKAIPEVKIVHVKFKHPDMPWLTLNFPLPEGDYEIWKGAIEKFNAMAAEPKPKLNWHE